MRMPEMTGIELLQYLKVRDNKMFIILMTAYGSFALGIESLKQGACDYLAKPFSLGVLKKKVGDALKRRTRFLEEQKETMDEW
jgi:FixJ family two-component response regulator